jgi:hypothetical protein
MRMQSKTQINSYPKGTHPNCSPCNRKTLPLGAVCRQQAGTQSTAHIASAKCVLVNPLQGLACTRHRTLCHDTCTRVTCHGQLCNPQPQSYCPCLSNVTFMNRFTPKKVSEKSPQAPCTATYRAPPPTPYTHVGNTVHSHRVLGLSHTA